MTKKATKTGKELERRVADAYHAMGAWKVEHDVELAGNQIDVYVELETAGRLLHRIAVEVKDWSKPVGIDVVNGFATIVKLLHGERLIDEGVIVSASGFSRPARNAAQTYDIHLLEPADLDAMVEEAKAAGRTKPTAPPIPPPPTPYVAHPYPAQEHFTGRERERADLIGWLTDDAAHPVLAIVAIGGMGKSALAWHWLQNDVLSLGLGHWDLRGVLWWSFYDRESGFEHFLERAVAYGSGGEMDAANWPVRDRMECLRALLAERRFLLVLDGAERLLRAYARMDAPYLGDDAGATHPQRATYRQCADPNVGTFLQWLAGLEATKTLLTTRLLPCELEGLAGVAERKLTRMDPQDAVRFFRAMKIRGTRAEIQAACAPYGYLPLALRLLTGLVAEDPARPGDVAVATEYEITGDLRGKEQHHILERAYDALDPAARELLSRIAAFRSSVGYGVLQALFTPSPPPRRGGEGAGGRGEVFRFPTERALKDTLRGLVKRGLLLRQEGTGRYDLHPVVRRYGYDRLADKESIHTRLRDYFAAVPPPEQVESLDDLAPTIELYHHTVCAGRYDETCDLFHDRLAKPLHFRFGAYQLRIKLLHALFPGGEPFTPSGEAVLPRLSKEAAQAWTLNELANSYSLSGQPGRAVPLFEKNAEHDERHNRKTHLATGLGNLATQQLAVGALAAAEGNLRRRIVLCQEIGDEFREAVGHQELGSLLAYTGAFEMAGAEIQASITYCEQFGHQQGYCQNMLTLTLRALLMGRINELTPPPPCTAESGERSEALLPAARQARELADVHGYERDIIRAEWLLGAAHRARGELAQAEPHLAEALRRCRRINLVEMEPDILLELARLRYAQMVSGSRFQVSGSGEEQPETLKPETKKSKMDAALSLAKEALDIADRCGYRLAQADAHLILAQLALSEVEGLAFEAGDLPEARRHAEAARERAQCDGPPHRYEAAFLEAERLLEQIEAA